MNALLQLLRVIGRSSGGAQRRFRDQQGFTLVEIMIVVALIALLAAIAMPAFLRARKRAQATHIIEDLRMIDAAIDQYALENNKAPTQSISWPDIKAYLKNGSRLYNTTATDVLGNYFIHGVIDQGVSLSRVTFDSLSDVAPLDFWSPYGVEP
jgi:prepilin-type N-terminal cleavage/methylation domain-containing protein